MESSLRYCDPEDMDIDVEDLKSSTLRVVEDYITSYCEKKSHIMYSM